MATLEGLCFWRVNTCWLVLAMFVKVGIEVFVQQALTFAAVILDIATYSSIRIGLWPIVILPLHLVINYRRYLGCGPAPRALSLRLCCRYGGRDG